MASTQNQGPQTVRVHFLGETDLRPGQEGLYTKDRFFLNAYFEPIKNPISQEIEFHFTKRPGTSRSQIINSGDLGKRVYFWTATNVLHAVTNNRLWNASIGDLGVTVTGVTGRTIGITETRPGVASQYLGVNTGNTLYLIGVDNSVIVLNGVAITSSSAANPTTITTATNHNLNTGNKVIIRNHTLAGVNDTIFTITRTGATTFTIPVLGGGTGGTLGTFPGSTTGDLVFLDGYWFVIDGLNRIWNCSVDDPTTWSTTSFINSQMLPGRGTGLARQSNYLIAFSDRHFQLFIDNANPFGSPLANVEQAEQQIGCYDTKSIAFTENTIYWVSNTFSGGLAVYRLDGTTNLKDITTPSLRRALQQAVASSTSNYRGFILRYAGHIFYILNISSTAINTTYVYDQSLDIWQQWSDISGTGVWPFADISQTSQSTFGSPTIPVMIHNTEGWIYTIDQNIFQDNFNNFPVIAETDPLTFGTMERKFYNRVELVGDKQSGTANVDVSYTDDDFGTFSPPRTFDITQVRAFSASWGNSRRRAWRVNYTGNTAFRALGLEFLIEKEG